MLISKNLTVISIKDINEFPQVLYPIIYSKYIICQY